MPLDVTDEAAWAKAVAATVEIFGGLHGLLNAAGVGVRNSIEDCTLEDYRRVNDVNSMGTFLGCKHAIPAMAKTIKEKGGGGSIVNISSVLGLRGASYAMAYCASKGAVRSLTKNVALHCAQMKYGIRCNSVHPGYIDTPMIAPRLSAHGRQHERPAVARGAPSARPPRPGGRGRQHDPLPAERRVRASRPARSSSATAASPRKRAA